MTPVQTTLRSCYLAGPMRGYDMYNFPAFREATKWLRSEGWTVFSPAERDEQDPDIDHEKNVAGWEGDRRLDYFMAHDLKAVCQMDAVICLPGWEKSQGARLEAMVAVEIDHPVFEIVQAWSLKPWGGWGSLPFTPSLPTRPRRCIVSVSNARVAAEFIAGTKAYRELPTLEVAR